MGLFPYFLKDNASETNDMEVILERLSVVGTSEVVFLHVNGKKQSLASTHIWSSQLLQVWESYIPPLIDILYLGNL